MHASCVASTVVTMSSSGFARSSISSRLVKVGQPTPIAFFATSTRRGLTSQRPTNSSTSA